jgi:hypothetical protein
MASEGDEAAKDERLRRTLAAAMGAGGQGARDGGRSRGALLRRAATIAHRDLGDLDQAFVWLGDALIAHVEASSLDALDELAHEVGDPKRAEETITRALSEVFDGPLVRQLLARRAKIRREQTNDKPGAAADLRKLHDLSPSDQTIMDDLSALLMELGDFRSMVQVYEDQLLRGKDMTARSELARKVARMWEEQLEDPREAADAWRRVLRMKAGDAEATAGLDRAKSSMLKKPDPGSLDAYSPPKLGPPVTVMPPPPRSPSAKVSQPLLDLPPDLSPDPPNPKPAGIETPSVAEAKKDADTPIPGVKEDLAGLQTADDREEAQDSEAPPPSTADPKAEAPFAEVDLAFAQITAVRRVTDLDESGADVSPAVPLDEDSGVDLAALSNEAADASGPSLPDSEPSNPEEEGEETDILVIDDIAEELEGPADRGDPDEVKAAPPDEDSKEAPEAPTSPSGRISGSSLPPPLPRH